MKPISFHKHVFRPNQKVNTKIVDNELYVNALQKTSTPGIFTNVSVKNNTNYKVSLLTVANSTIGIYAQDAISKKIFNHYVSKNSKNNQCKSTFFFNTGNHTKIRVGVLFNDVINDASVYIIQAFSINSIDNNEIFTNSSIIITQPKIISDVSTDVTPPCESEKHTAESESGNADNKDTSVTEVTENYVQDKIEEISQKISEEMEMRIKYISELEQKKILVIIDTHNWAFDKIYNYMSRCDTSGKNYYQKLAMIDISQLTYDEITMYKSIRWDYIIEMYYAWGKTVYNFLDRLHYKKKIVSVYDFYWTISEPRKTSLLSRSKKADYVLGACPELVDSLKTIIINPKITFGSCFDGVDTKHFKMKPLRYVYPKDKLIIGIMGNKECFGHGYDNKGFNVFKQLVNILDKSKFDWYILEKNTNYIPYEKMHEEFYSKIDVYICLSKLEGTATGVLEAMSSGVYWFTTPCGLVNYILSMEPVLSDHIVNRDVNDLVQKLEELYDNQKMIEINNVLSRRVIEHLSWDNACQQYYKIFESE